MKNYEKDAVYDIYSDGKPHTNSEVYGKMKSYFNANPDMGGKDRKKAVRACQQGLKDDGRICRVGHGIWIKK